MVSGLICSRANVRCIAKPGSEAYYRADTITDGGLIVNSELVGLLAVSVVFSAIAIIEGMIVSPIFYSMAGIILAMFGYLVLSDKLDKKPEEPPQEKE